MTEHACTELTPGCYRCEIAMDQADGWCGICDSCRDDCINSSECIDAYREAMLGGYGS